MLQKKLNLEDFLDRLSGKIIIAGIGNSLRGDDAVGSYIVKNLQGRIKAVTLDCEDSPEKYIDKFIDLKPDLIIFIDAMRLNRQPGELIIISNKDIANKGTITHQTNLHLIIHYIKLHINPQIFIIGIQPEDTTFGNSISHKVRETANIICELFIERLSNDK